VYETHGTGKASETTGNSNYHTKHINNQIMRIQRQYCS